MSMALMLTALLAAAGENPTLNLVRDGKSSYSIVLSETPSPAETTAAKELQSHLKQVTGAELAISSCRDVPANRPQIVVGDSPRLRQLLPAFAPEKLAPDAIVIKTVGDKLLLAGRPPRGALYAVYTFLEDQVGCRWWTSTEQTLPHKPNLSVGPLDVHHAPALRYREAYYRDSFPQPFAARMKLNGSHHRAGPEYGENQRFCGFVHTFYPLLPPEKYFEKHPEWYSEIKGKRKWEHAQLCLTNEEMRQELVRVLLTRLRKDPQAALASVSQNDWHGRCECEKCKAIEAEEDSPSGPLLRFVNSVAADVEKEFPHLLVETLAYQYTRKPPQKTRPRGNVIIRLCSIECSFVQPLGAGPQNEKFRDDIEGWSRIAPQLFVWDYVTNFSNYILPHPNLRVLGPNVRFFTEHKVVGLFEQGDAGSTVGDFIRMRAWLLAHLMWNPRQSEPALIHEFLCGYYGAAGPHLDAYLNMLHDTAERSGVYLKCFMENTAGWLTLEDLNQATSLYRAAEEAVQHVPELARRVRRERLPLDHAWLSRYESLRRSARLKKVEFLGPSDPAAACAEFVALCQEFRTPEWRETQKFADFAEKLKHRFRTPGKPPAECRGLGEDDWLDIQDNQFRLHKPGELSAIVDDAAASDGKAVRMPGDHFEWATSFPFSADMAFGNPWHCYAVARCEASAAKGPAMTMGIYDTEAKRGVTHRSVKVEELAGKEYRVFDLGVHELRPSMYCWIAPPKRPGEVGAVYVDRIFLVRAKKAGP